MRFRSWLCAASLLLVACGDESAAESNGQDESSRADPSSTDGPSDMGGADEPTGEAGGAAPSCQPDADDAAPGVSPADVQPSGLSGPIAALSDEDKQAYCDWQWSLPGYGDEYCCDGVFHPQRVAVDGTETRESCLADLQRFDPCEEVLIEFFEDCAIARLARICGTPDGCLAFGHGALTSTCAGP
ncbi:MAG: hypothetical protein OXT09_33435 [Myxococcales bacterium]|nr:hypothetical protein [Myxococcales bacterium]